jgi:hypothetical protein
MFEGPYAQRGVWVLPNAKLGASFSGEFVLEERGYTDSGVDWFTYFTESGESIKGPSVRAFPAQLRMA